MRKDPEWKETKPVPIGKGKPAFPRSLSLEGGQRILVSGPRGSGKTGTLIKWMEEKHPNQTALVVLPWATEKQWWGDELTRLGIGKTAIHTPDSLARYLLSLWAKRKKKPLRWVLEKVQQGPRTMEDETSHAKTILKAGEMTAGVAHWLLNNELEAFLKEGMIPKIDILCMDEPAEWDEEAEEWITRIPHRTRIWTERGTGNRYLGDSPPTEKEILEGWTDRRGNLWKVRGMHRGPLGTQAGHGDCLVLQKTKRSDQRNRLEKLVEKYGPQLKQMEVRSAEQTKGRRFNHLWIPEEEMPTPWGQRTEGWGNKRQAKEWLDLVASRGPATILCKKENIDPKKSFLIWEA
jgi:hypothetical protein